MLHYPESFITALQAIWGDGFLSPGGPAEVATMLTGVDLSGLSVLDIGCGVGGIDCLLVREHGAKHVIGIDVEPQLVDHAKARVAREGLTDRIDIRLVTPGPLPLEDASIDAVFSKDAMLHIPDKAGIYAEILRVLKPGGLFVASDWLRGGADDRTVPDILVEWGAAMGLDAAFFTPAMTEKALTAAGFSDVRVNDRHAWYHKEIENEAAMVTGDGFDRLVAAIGRDGAENRVESYTLRQRAVDEGALRPTHLFGRKPG
ncbi:class I SAM-dependent methyltransferase [Rhodospirillaceae bacterium KN72]|uniref:Class I SAM-dependent methyltransferase n=1 Tax=Pacificispira spongiicola TaxID=2729598 RepID=A0A7Y0HGC5_9PROT|nr:class I SAM-dependent methyltransferase [Pacificispira spongiicola]NMM45533.1 class I SAM-dependent methyltransferase [Pacificispira spongiicola]